MYLWIAVRALLCMLCSQKWSQGDSVMQGCWDEVSIDDIQWGHVSDTDGPRSLPPRGREEVLSYILCFRLLDASKDKAPIPDP